MYQHKYQTKSVAVYADCYLVQICFYNDNNCRQNANKHKLQSELDMQRKTTIWPAQLGMYHQQQSEGNSQQ